MRGSAFRPQGVSLALHSRRLARRPEGGARRPPSTPQALPDRLKEKGRKPAGDAEGRAAARAWPCSGARQRGGVAGRQATQPTDRALRGCGVLHGSDVHRPEVAIRDHHVFRIGRAGAEPLVVGGDARAVAALDVEGEVAVERQADLDVGEGEVLAEDPGAGAELCLEDVEARSRSASIFSSGVPPAMAAWKAERRKLGCSVVLPHSAQTSTGARATGSSGQKGKRPWRAAR